MRFVAQGLELPDRLKGAVPKRQVEFLAGRYCASAALRKLGYRGEPVLGSRADRSPLWPQGWHGSISHCFGRAIAVVGADTRVRGIGVDIEELLEPDSVDSVGRQVMGVREWAMATGQGFSEVEAVTLVFSIKESIYKALNPFGAAKLGFSDLEVRGISRADGTFDATLRGGADVPDVTPTHWSGRFLLTEKQVISLLWIPLASRSTEPS